MRYNDVRNNTKVADGVLEKYTKALNDKGMIGDDGLFKDFYRLRQTDTIPPPELAFTAWLVYSTIQF